MKIYIAGKLGEEDSIQELMDYFRNLGHVITFDWTKTPHLKPFEDHFPEAEKCAVEEVRGVKKAELFVLLSNDKGVGMFVEFGVALGKGIPIIVVTGDNRIKTSFFCHPKVTMVKDLATLKSVINLFT